LVAPPAAVDGAAGHGDAAGELLLDQREISGLHQPGADAEVVQGLELDARVGGVATCLLVAVCDGKVLHHRQEGVVTIGARKRAGFEGLQEHGSAGGEAGAFPLTQLGAIALLEAGNALLGIGVAAGAGADGGLHRSRCGHWSRFGAPQPPEGGALTSASGSWSTRRSSAACSQARCRSSSGSK